MNISSYNPLGVFIKGVFFWVSFIIINHCGAQSKTYYNLSFEQVDDYQQPREWRLFNGPQNDGNQTVVDSSTAEQGKVSLRISITHPTSNPASRICAYTVPANSKGKKITVTGYIKTEGVKNGSAYLWLRVVDKNSNIQHEVTKSKGIKNTTDWGKYKIDIPYDWKNAKSFAFGAILAGGGTMWLDNLNIYIDGKAVGSSSTSDIPPATKDTSFSDSSKISSINLTSDKIKLLTNLGMIWGFLKYYHPEVIQGKYNWDAALFKLLPGLLKSPNNQTAYQIIEQWINNLGPITSCMNCSVISPGKTKVKPDYGYLFTKANLPVSLIKSLQYIRDNFKPELEQYYIKYKEEGNPLFTNEIAYRKVHYPDAGLRLLSLYRYWNIIQYFFPSRYLIGDDWNKVLVEFIPKFIHAKDRADYMLACLELIGRVHDSHAGIWIDDPALDSAKGMLMSPFQAKFIEHKLIVTNYYKNIPGLENKIHIGDIIEKIDGIWVDSLIRKYLPLTPASNYDTQLRDMPTSYGFLLRNNWPVMNLQIRRRDSVQKVFVTRIPVHFINRSIDLSNPTKLVGYKMLSNNIGYIYPAKLKEGDFDRIKTLFAHTHGIIFDLRCYPAVSIPYVYDRWLKKSSTPFAYFTHVSLTHPGTITYGDTTKNGDPSLGTYKGKIIVIVNAISQSNAEFTAMALSTVPNAKVIGSTTAGADGEVSLILLPGGIPTYISGIGVYYPDGTEAQRKGVKIDIPMKPTNKGFRMGKDELLDKAVQMIVDTP